MVTLDMKRRFLTGLGYPDEIAQLLSIHGMLPASPEGAEKEAQLAQIRTASVVESPVYLAIDAMAQWMAECMYPAAAYASGHPSLYLSGKQRVIDHLRNFGVAMVATLADDRLVEVCCVD